MKTVPLTAYPRSLARRAGAKKLRANGRVPAVIYGRETQPKNLEIDRIALHELIHHSVSENLLLDLAVAEDSKPKRLVLVQEIQHHPLSGGQITPTHTKIISVPILRDQLLKQALVILR